MTETRFHRAKRGVLVTLAAAAVAGAGLAAAGHSPVHVSAATSSSSPGYAVSAAIDPTSGNTYIAAQGPGHSLYFYWNLKGTWYGPLAVGANGSTFSAPSLAIDSNSNVVISAQGPGNTLWFYWNVKGTWHGPLQIGGARIGDFDAVDPARPGRQPRRRRAELWPVTSFFWGVKGTWYGPAVLGSAGMSLSAPSLSAGTTTPHRLFIATRGPNNSLVVFENSSGTWATPAVSNAQTTFAAPGNSEGTFYVQGAGNDLDNWLWTINSSNNAPYVFGDWPIGPGGSTLSAVAGSGGSAATAIGPSNSLFFYWNSNNWNGPLGLGGPNASFSVPSIASKAGDGSNPAIAVEGPANSLDFYWNISGTWYGPVGVGGAGTTFSSAS